MKFNRHKPGIWLNEKGIKHYSVKEASKVSGVPNTKLNNKIQGSKQKEGKLPANVHQIQTNGRRSLYVINENELTLWKSEHEASIKRLKQRAEKKALDETKRKDKLVRKATVSGIRAAFKSDAAHNELARTDRTLSKRSLEIAKARISYKVPSFLSPREIVNRHPGSPEWAELHEENIPRLLETNKKVHELSLRLNKTHDEKIKVELNGMMEKQEKLQQHMNLSSSNENPSEIALSGLKALRMKNN